MDEVAFALVLNLHQPAGNLEDLFGQRDPDREQHSSVRGRRHGAAAKATSAIGGSLPVTGRQ